MAFLNDIESKHLSTFVLVTIGNDICISTQKITFDGKYYKPILLNVPAISESLDIEQRKYKISSVSLSISDYLEDGERFSDTLNTLMNKEVNIYYASASSKEFSYFGDDLGTTQEDAHLYKAGTYIVRSFSQDEDKVTLNCEDLSQDKLHKDFPLDELGDDDIVPDKYKNKPIPMVFGEVDRSPCVVSKGVDFEDFGNGRIKAGDKIESFVSGQYGDTNVEHTPLFIYEQGKYYSVRQESSLGSSIGSFENHTQFDLDNETGEFVLLGNSGSESFNDTNLSIDSLEVDTLLNPEKVIPNSSYKSDLYNINTVYVISENINHSIDLNSDTKLSYNSQNIFSPDTGVAGSATNNSNHYFDGFVFELGGNIFNSSNLNHNEDDEMIVECELLVKAYFKLISSTSSFPSTDLKTFNQTNAPIALTSQVTVEGNFAPIDNMFSSSFTSISNYQHKVPTNLQTFLDMNTGLGEEIEFELYGIGLYAKGEVNKITNRNFYASVIGRQGSAPSSQSIYSEILSELDFDEELIQEQLNDIELGQYAFTVDKKTNSKKLIEELSQSTPLYPYFKDGEFRIKSIKTDYDGTNNIIKAKDVIKYKYDRTKIEKVYSRVNVKYHYDYGLKDFTKETGFVSANQLASIDGYLIGDNEDYFGQDFDQEFVFESKYIRHEPTALNLAKYLVGLHANQHNIINLTLPLNYLTLELGDIVKFDSLIQGRKIFGEDYTVNQNRNGQNIYPYFFVEQIKKSLDKVEIKLYQLHNFSFDDSIIYGCTNQNAENYDPSANTDDGSCILPELEQGCTNPDSLNYNPNAQEDNGTCVNQLQLLAPQIITPTDGQVFSNEFIAEELGNNLIPSPADNSTFDTTSAATGEFFATTATEGSALGYITIFYDGLEIQTADDWYNVVVHNISTFQFNAPIIEANGNIVDGWNLRVDNMIFNVGDDVRFSLQAYTDSSWYPTDIDQSHLSFQNEYLGVYLSYSPANYGLALDINENLYEGSTYRLSFKHKMLIGSPANLFVSLGGVTSDSITPNLSEEWAEASVDLTMTSDSVNPIIHIYIEQSIYTDFSDLYIDDVYLKEVLNEGGVDIPQAIVEWNPSPNLISEIPQLGLTTTGAYYYKIEDLDGNYSHNLFPIPASNNINSIVIDFDQVNIPQNVLLKLTIGCYSEQTYQGNPVFISDNIINGLPVAEDYTFFSWGEVDDIIDGDIVLGDVNMDGVVNVADIVLMVTHILTLGGSDLTAEQIIAADLTGDGVVNVTDIVAVIAIILGD